MKQRQIFQNVYITVTVPEIYSICSWKYQSQILLYPRILYLPRWWWEGKELCKFS